MKTLIVLLLFVGTLFGQDFNPKDTVIVHVSYKTLSGGVDWQLKHETIYKDIYEKGRFLRIVVRGKAKKEVFIYPWSTVRKFKIVRKYK